MKKIVSDSYRDQLKMLHDKSASFGVGSVTAKHYPTIFKYIEKKNYQSVLDYGCGKGHFLEAVKSEFSSIDVAGFDVASEEFNELKEREYDLVVCLDVMEHVEYGALASVFSEIALRTGKLFICSVANYPAAKKLPDGRNAHVTQLPFGFWFTLLSSAFRVDQFVRTNKAEGLFVCTPLSAEADWR